jgi:hypothetical protein
VDGSEPTEPESMTWGPSWCMRPLVSVLTVSTLGHGGSMGLAFRLSWVQLSDSLSLPYRAKK